MEWNQIIPQHCSGAKGGKTHKFDVASTAHAGIDLYSHSSKVEVSQVF